MPPNEQQRKFMLDNRLTPVERRAYMLLCEQDRIASELRKPELRAAVHKVLGLIQKSEIIETIEVPLTAETAR